MQAQRLSRSLVKSVEGPHRVVGAIDRHEHMIVMHGRHDIATDAGIGEGRGYGGSQADRVQIGMHRQRNPRGAKGRRQSMRDGDVLLDNQADTFAFEEGRDRTDRPHINARRDRHEAIDAFVQDGLRRAQQLAEIRDRPSV